MVSESSVSSCWPAAAPPDSSAVKGAEFAPQSVLDEEIKQREHTFSDVDRYRLLHAKDELTN